MRNRLIAFVAVVLVATGFGCGGSGNNYTCNFAASAGVCWEWQTPQALTSQQVTQLQSACTAGGAGGTFSTGGTCPSASRIGSCALTNSQVSGTSYKYVFYAPTYTVTSGQQFCTGLGGTWTAG